MGNYLDELVNKITDDLAVASDIAFETDEEAYTDLSRALIRVVMAKNRLEHLNEYKTKKGDENNE